MMKIVDANRALLLTFDGKYKKHDEDPLRDEEIAEIINNAIKSGEFNVTLENFRLNEKEIYYLFSLGYQVIEKDFTTIQMIRWEKPNPVHFNGYNGEI